jgi:RimJ/RimL family protein N-acetyltransferase
LSSRESDDPPFDGDPGWRAKRTLPDGTEIVLRPMVPEDREELRSAFRNASPRTRYLRFFGFVGEPSEQMLTYLTCVDQKDHVALVATVASPDLKEEHGIGVARFVRLPESPDVAEAAITVADEMQRRGVGTALARELERAARLRGIHRLRAEVLASNAAMRAILDHAGAKPAMSPGASGTLAYDIALEHDVREAAPASRKIVDVLRGAAETMAMTIRRLMPPESETANESASTPAAEDGDPDQAER